MIMGWLPQDVSTFGPSIDAILRLIIYVVGTAFLLTEGTLLAFVILYRRRQGARAHFVRGDSLPQKAWVLIPVVIVGFLDIAMDVSARPIWNLVKEQRPAAALTVKLEALQFGWEFTYPGPDGQFGTHDDLMQTTTLTVPVGQVIRLLIESQDVIHSFYVPQLRLRQDAVPGRVIPAWFEATRPGKYEIACSQLCGNSHFAMKGILRVLSAEDYQRWISEHWPKPGAAAPKGSSASTSGVGG
jgi:cytochrome c oxidase subunit II